MTRRHFNQLCATVGAATALQGCSTAAALAPGAAAALAPRGRLRACINLGNPILARRDDQGVVSGVSVDLATSLAAQLAVPLELVVVEAALQSVQTVRADGADIGFFAIDPHCLH